MHGLETDRAREFETDRAREFETDRAQSPPKWKGGSMPGKQKRFQALDEKEQLQLDCKASGKPKPAVTWLKDGIPIQDSDHVKVRKYRLTIAEAKTNDTGNYTCEVSNKFGRIDWKFIVEVRKKPWPMRLEGPTPENITVTVGSSAEFRCRVTNDAMAVIRWQKIELDDNGNITKGSEVFLESSESGVLTLRRVQKSDEGVYACIASNVEGMKMKRGYLKVVDSDVLAVENGDFDRNRNNQFTRGRQNSYDDNSYGILDENDPLVDTVQSGGREADFSPHYETTRRPRNRNGKNKNGRKKNGRKNKKDRSKSTTTTTASPVAFDPSRSTTPTIWDFGNKDNNDFGGMRDTRYNVGSRQPVDPDTEVQGPTGDDNDSGKSFKEGDAANAKAKDKDGEGGGMRVWTIYTIVGGVCGVILLIGLVAITLTLCCKQEEQSVYKSSTPV
ncbi:fibroblast growth factor receptor [Plakobranchus ocellatus]|uniref:receptor protein-tyrosine kinase n=1 Tax=Plakobranchus ocellatus TaxID=259542 RepID=A0AAV4E1S0_9GAST|nr:fibroblast growth factor receptor [Plakobranchus ocellatus]